MGLLPTLLTIHPANPRPSPLAPLLQSPPSTLSPRRQTPSLQSEQPRENQQLGVVSQHVVPGEEGAPASGRLPRRHASAWPPKSKPGRRWIARRSLTEAGALLFHAPRSSPPAGGEPAAGARSVT